MKQARCRLPADAAGRVLDRLLLLEQVIGADGVQQALADTACFDSRSCTLTREVIFWTVLAMGIFTDLPIRQVFKAARRLRPTKPRPIAPACAWPDNAWGWPPSAACSSGPSAPWRRRRRPVPSTTPGG